MKLKPSVGRAEMDILRYIADHPGATVGEVGEYLAETKGQTRNTALNVMERLRTKGFLRREKVDNIFRYSPSVSKPVLFEQLVGDFVESTLGGSYTPIIAYLTEKVELNDEQFDELKALVKELEDRRR
jgi:predicted transcriptional regulator